MKFWIIFLSELLQKETTCSKEKKSGIGYSKTLMAYPLSVLIFNFLLL